MKVCNNLKVFLPAISANKAENKTGKINNTKVAVNGNGDQIAPRMEAVR
jgi:hypothetical protein